MIHDAVRWFRGHPDLLLGSAVLSVVLFVAGILLVPVLVARLPADAFVPGRKPAFRRGSRHPLVRLILRVGKNFLGLVLVLLGIAMLVLPGQGILTIVMGLGLLDFPGKQSLLQAVVHRPAVARALTWIRRRAGKEPFL